MKESTLSFHKLVSAAAARLELRCSEYDARRRRFLVSFADHFPLWLIFSLDDIEENAFFYVAGRVHGVDGDKTDYHDLLSSFFAISFRLLNMASAQVIKIEMEDILPGEVYSFNVVFPKQPPLSFIDPRHSIEKVGIDEILTASSLTARLISAIWRGAGEGRGESKWSSADDVAWITTIRKKMMTRAGYRAPAFHRRESPTWEYLRFHEQDLFMARFPVPIASVFYEANYIQTLRCLDGVKGKIMESPNIKNAISFDALKLGRELCSLLGHSEREVLVVPTDSHLYLLFKTDIVAIACPCGLGEYLSEKRRVIKRHQRDSFFISTAAKYSWCEPVDDDEFEKLILELVNREEGVQRARKIGKGRERDAGRDILAEWYRPYTPARDTIPVRLERVVIQCKALKRPVDKSKIPDVVDLLEFHRARGYLVVSLTGVTAPVIDFLERMSERKNIWADWWDKIEIEDRLRANPDIASRYSHIVKSA